MDINKAKALCFTGHRSEKLPQTAEELEALKLTIFEEIDKAVTQGFDTFLMGGCYGFDLMAASQVHLRSRIIKPDDPKQIKLIGVVPFEGQANRWKEADREQYFDTLPLCDEVVTLHTQYQNGCYHERNRWLVDHSSRMICYYDGSGSGTGYTVDYAEKAGMPITNLYQK